MSDTPNTTAPAPEEPAPKKPRKNRDKSATSPKRIEVTEKQRQALEYRKMGASFSQIAEQVGYKTAQHAHYAVMSALRKTIQEPADEVRKLELERLDAMFLPQFQKAIAGDGFAMQQCLSIMNRRSAYLGLNAAVKIESDNTVRTEAGVLVLPGVATDPAAWEKAVVAQQERLLSAGEKADDNPGSADLPEP